MGHGDFDFFPELNGMPNQREHQNLDPSVGRFGKASAAGRLVRVPPDQGSEEWHPESGASKAWIPAVAVPGKRAAGTQPGCRQAAF